MSERKRLRRDDPARTSPVRDFSKLYRRPQVVKGGDAVKPDSSDASRTGGARGPLAEGVELAYSVIEKYIAEGRRTAEGLNNQPYTTRVTNENLQDILERVLRLQAEALPLWIETLATLTKVNPSRNGYAAPPDVWPRPNGTPNSETTPVSIEVLSVRPVQVSIELRPNCDAQSLVALGLNAVDSRKPAVTDVSFVPDTVRGRVKLCIRIPDNQPPGTYSGVIVNRDSSETRGTLSIRIAD
jgi:hypothetical protein